VLGPYASREEAVNARTELVEAGFPDSQIVPGTRSLTPTENVDSQRESKQIVSLSVPGRTSIVIEGAGKADGPSFTTSQGGRFVVDVDVVPARGWTGTLVANDAVPFVQEVAVAEVPGSGASARLQVTVTLRKGAIGSLRPARGRMYLDFVQGSGENSF
jgi:hypothetical protein